MRVIINSIEELPDLAARITKAYSNKVIAFYGEMSAGKTTFTVSYTHLRAHET